ncbi:hypothetical protein ADUPG1_013268 [Aduncisulcus paluster]|uniref:Uncharacterized protein n=1 Tax=Aduncisulcus paluster TaxID=2918883 RepID=A0ABQ5K2B6_9EUKA|nr:hypothetical protein ADUPG1_013268 [Aduncisulcus paluster]
MDPSHQERTGATTPRVESKIFHSSDRLPARSVSIDTVVHRHSYISSDTSPHERSSEHYDISLVAETPSTSTATSFSYGYSGDLLQDQRKMAPKIDSVQIQSCNSKSQKTKSPLSERSVVTSLLDVESQSERGLSDHSPKIGEQKKKQKDSEHKTISDQFIEEIQPPSHDLRPIPSLCKSFQNKSLPQYKIESGMSTSKKIMKRISISSTLELFSFVEIVFTIIILILAFRKVFSMIERP